MITSQSISPVVENLTVSGRFSRLLLGVGMLAPLLLSSGYVGGAAVLALLAIFPLSSGLVGYCPLTAWWQSAGPATAAQELTVRERQVYAVTAVALVGSVFLLQGQILGYWAVLPLLGIYPAVASIYGVHLFRGAIRAVTGSTLAAPVATAVPLSARIFSLLPGERTPQVSPAVEHAA